MCNSSFAKRKDAKVYGASRPSSDNLNRGASMYSVRLQVRDSRDQTRDIGWSWTCRHSSSSS